MAGIKKRGIVSTNNKKYINGVEVKPTLFVWAGGKQRLGGSVDGEMIRDEKNDIVPFHSIQGD